MKKEDLNKEVSASMIVEAMSIMYGNEFWGNVREIRTWLFELQGLLGGLLSVAITSEEELPYVYADDAWDKMAQLAQMAKELEKYEYT